MITIDHINELPVDKLIDVIKGMSYTQFVGFINQWNVPPGSLNTINQWSVFGHVTNKSRVLEIACTTGLSSREIARITNCSAVGIDICPVSIEAAKMNANIYGSCLDLEYICQDACAYECEKKFTHIIMGSCLGFFSNPQTILNRLPSFFDKEGYILASPYYSNGNMPKSIIEDCKRIIEITPTTTGYDTVRDIYSDYEVIYENRCFIELETEKQIKKYVGDCIENACKLRNIKDELVKKTMYDRLYEIKYVSNELHRYQAFSVMVLRYLNAVYPNRFIELF